MAVFQLTIFHPYLTKDRQDADFTPLARFVYPAVYTKSACRGDSLCIHVNNKSTEKPRFIAVDRLLE